MFRCQSHWLAIVCKFLYMVLVNDFPMSQKGVVMGNMFFVCGVPGDNKLLQV